MNMLEAKETVSDRSDMLITYEDALMIIGIRISKVTIWRWERLGLFPKRVKLPGARVAWKHSEITEWLRRQIENRNSYLPLGDVR